MSTSAPPIVQLAERVLSVVEEDVRRFPRYHKYAVGADLRAQARTVARLALRAWRDSDDRGAWLNRLVFGVDDLKLTLQIAQRIEAFQSFAQFEALARLVSDLGRQCGGWRKLHRKGQNRTASVGAGSAQRLSARAASAEART